MSKPVMYAAFATALCLVGASSVSHAQTSRDELVAKGATQLTSAELKELLLGKEMSGPMPDGSALELSVKSDGSLAGGQTYPGRGRVMLTGTWAISDKGQFCTVVHARWGYDQYNKSERCADWIRLGSDVYSVLGDRALKRELK